MKKRDIWISVAVIAAAVLLLFFYSQGKSQKGQIKIDAGGAAAKLQLAGGLFDNATISSGAEPTKVSAQAHRPEQLSLSMKQGGDTWRIDSSGPWGKLSTISVNDNDTTVLELGQPLLIKPSVNKSSSLVSIGLSIIGRAGVHYKAAITKNGKRLPPPKLKIIDETGNVLASGKFEYG